MDYVKTFDEFLNENGKTSIKEDFNYEKLSNLAKGISYDIFLNKSDSLTNIYDILYRGLVEGDELTDKSFFSDYIGHARQYGEWVDGIIINNNDTLFFTDDVFNNLRNKFINITKKELNNIYSYYFINHKLFDVMVGEYSEEKAIINFVSNFIKSNIPYTKVQNNKVKNDLLIPIMVHYAKIKSKNIISFVGGDYSDYGGADEFVVNDISRYKTLKQIWEEANKKPV